MVVSSLNFAKFESTRLRIYSISGMKKLLTIIILLFSSYTWAQSNMVVVTSTVPSQLTICGAAKEFQVTIYNPTPFLITSDTLKISMPTGIEYNGVFTGPAGTSYLSHLFPNTEVFLLPNIPALTPITIKFWASAKCSVLGFISGGGITKNNIRVNYTANGIQGFDTQNTNSYLIKQPYLTITTVTNQSYTGNIGDVFTRCITIINAGSGELNGFTFTDTHGSGIQINSVSTGTLFHVNPTLEKIVVDSNHFAGIGDGDKLFETGESIVICETVTILNCIAASSAFKAFWGCSVNSCQSTVSSANIVFPNYIPNLVVTPIASMNSCIGAGNASLQQLKIVNSGLGNAVNIALEIFQATGGGYNNTVGSNIDPASITIQTGLTGTSSAVTPTSTAATNGLGCMTNATGKVTFSISQINAGDTIYIKWNSYSCCFNACTNTGRSYINGWRYKGSYQSICQNNYVIYENWGRVYSNIYGSLVDNGSPSTLSFVQTGTFKFLFSNYGNSYPVGPGAQWKFEITLPTSSCLSYAGNLHILRSNGVNTWLPSSVTTSGNILTAVFNGSPPWSLAQAELKFDLSLDCSNCTGQPGSNSITVKSFYIPNNTCGCEVGVSCFTLPLSINCPDPCVGLEFTYFELKRTNFGAPDNEANGGNGLPDGSGSLDFTKVKAIRAMFGDTIKASFNGRMQTNMTYPSWQYCFARERLSNGTRVTYIDAQFKIYRGGFLIATCTGFTPTVTDSGSTRIFNYNLSTSMLGSCFAGPYQQDDSVVFEPRYKVTSNIGNAAPLLCYSSNYYYVSDIPNPDPHLSPSIDSTHKFQCGIYNGSCSIIGYWFRNWDSESYDTKSCNNVVLSQNYHVSIGPGNNNDAGGNLFPYEYRNWAHMDTLTAIVPSGYTLISARFRENRTAGTLTINTSPWITLTPLNLNSDTLCFPIEQYYQNQGGSIPISDDGFDCVLEITLQPSCTAVPIVYQDVRYDWRYETIPQLTGPGSDTTFLSETDDFVVYDPPDLFLQSLLPSVFALNTTTSWDITISNTSNVSDAINTWISAPVISGVTITQVLDLDNNTIIPLTPGPGNMYHIDTVHASSLRNFRLTGTFTSCSVDSIIIYSGWNCYDGYPSNINTYPCTPERIALTLTPLTPAFSINSAGPASIDLCDTAEYVLDGSNIQLGTGYDIFLRANLPPGSSYVINSSKISYPDSNSYSSIPDPAISGDTLIWDISASDSLIGVDGLKGLLNDSLNSFRLKFKIVTLPDCNFVPGSSIYFVLTGEAACGLATELDVSLSPPLYITGGTQPYTAGIRLTTDYLSPCAENSTMRVSVINYGPPAFGITDSVSVKLPAGVSFVPGSFSNIHNAPVSGTPLQYTSGGSTYLVWRLPPGTNAGDSSVFSFDYSGNPHELSCSVVFFEAEAYSVSVLSCIGSGLTCVTNIATGDTSLAVFTYKAYLALANASAIATPNPPNQETITLDFDITNTGQAILTNADSIIQFYFDTDADGMYSTGDLFLAQDTIIIPKDSTIHYSKTMNVAAGQTCSIIAIVDPMVNPCVCNPAQIQLQPLLQSLNNDTTVCSGETVPFGSAPITAYSYTWIPTEGLNDSTIANPVLTTSNLSATPVSTTYILTTNRIGCSSKDTITVTVNPIPFSNAGSDIAICPNDTAQLGSDSNAGYTYSWSPPIGLSGTTLSNPTVTLVSPGATTYTVTTTALGCVSVDSVIVTVNPIPVSQAGTDIFTCATAVPGNLGTGSTNGYSYLWTPGTGLSDSTISNPSVSLLTADTTTYIVTTTALGCTSSDTVIVSINSLPTAVLNGTTVVCKNDSAPDIIFIGADGIPPYTFTYILNNGAPQTISTLVGDSVSIPVSTTVAGTYTYILISVQESSSLACPQSQYDSAVVIVNPLPEATISGTTEVCNNDLAPNITFTGSSGTPPYTFTYTLNSGSNQTVTTISGNSIDLPVSTATPDTFIYVLVSVQDASLSTCIQLQPDTATIIVNPLPAADFAVNSVCLNENSAFYDSSSIVEGTISEWLWDFGNTSPANTNENPVYVYSAPGTYTVSLIVTSGKGCKDTVIKNTIIHPLPDAQFSTSPPSSGICDGTPILFNDASTVANPDTIQLWIWDLGDGSPPDTNQNISHLYASDSLYLVELAVVSDFGCKDSVSKPVVINPNPVVNFTGNPVIGCEPLCVSFMDSSFISTGSNVSWSWDVGDGALVSNSQNFEHCYNNDSSLLPQLFNIVLTVTSDSGCVNTVSKSNYITVYPKPFADFGVDPETTTVVNPLVSFIDLSTGTTIWNWDFGDGTGSNQATPDAHTYPNDTGTYLITLITSTQYDCRDTAFKSVVVEGDFAFYIPNAFTPNGDNVNDYFFGKGIGITEYDLWIFDRWGQMIYHGEEIPVENAKWDGKANNGKEPAQMDVYVWKVTLTDIFNREHKYIGTVTLVR